MATVSTASGPHILCADLVRIFTAEGVEVQALQGLNLRVERGELVAVVGASGSGKSTLLTILSGLDTPTAGVARGRRPRPAHHGRRASASRTGAHTVGFVWQQTSRNLLPYLTAAENVALAMRSPAVGERRARAAPRRRAARAARGRRLRATAPAARCRAASSSAWPSPSRVANEPQVLLADEPTGELDEATSARTCSRRCAASTASSA